MTKVLTLYYHRVADLDRDINLLAVSPENFRQQLLWLKDYYNIVRTTDNWNSLSEDSICITFDDGYVDNLTDALPILEDVNVPATMFISTMGLIGEEQPWWDCLEYYLFSDVKHDFFALDDEIFCCEWEVNSLKKKINCYKALHFLMKNYCDNDRRMKWLEQLSDWSGLVFSKKLLVNKSHIEELSKSSLIDIGAHTITHAALSTLGLEMQEREIMDSKACLENIINRKIDLFSIPFGVRDVDYLPETIEIIKKEGIFKNFTTNSGLWTPKDDFYEIPRRVVRNWNFYQYESKIREYWNA